jgi:hypothetical protein
MNSCRRKPRRRDCRIRLHPPAAVVVAGGPVGGAVVVAARLVVPGQHRASRSAGERRIRLRVQGDPACY